MTTTGPVEDDAADWIYRLEVAHLLPLIDLERTPIAALVAKENQIKFMDLMRRMYARFGTMYRFSGVLMIVILLVPRGVGLWLTFPTVLLALPSTCLRILMNSCDVLRILPQQYEFWFFTIMNTINWSCLASFYSDFRVLSLFGGIVGTQLVILIDSNFRTVTSSIRSTRVAAPVLLVFGIATFLRVIDTDDDNYRVIPVAKVTISLIDVFANTSLTLDLRRAQGLCKEQSADHALGIVADDPMRRISVEITTEEAVNGGPRCLLATD